MLPATLCLLQIHYRLEHQTPMMTIGASGAPSRRQQSFKPAPDHLGQITLPRLYLPRFSLWPLVLTCSTLAPSVMIIARPGLMPAPPRRPVQYRLYVAFDDQDQLPEQAA